MTQAALDPRSSSLSSSRRASQSWMSPALTGAMLVSLSFHAVPVLQAIRDLVEVRQFVGEARTTMHEFLWATYEVEPPPPPKTQEPEKPKEPEPEPEAAPAPAPKPVVQPQAKPADKPAETKPVEPPPAAAQAGKTLTAADDVADFSNDFAMVQGDGRYAGGTTAAKGTATSAVRDPNAKEGGVPGGKGSAAAPPPPPSSEPDRSRPARPSNAAWSCSHLFPPEADAEGIDNATVSIAVTVRTDGSVQSVKVLNDPGNGFGRAARTRALSQRFEPAFDRAGQPTTATTAPFTVRFTR